MTPSISLAPPSLLRQTVTDGALASALSAAALLWRGRSDAGSAVAPINAISHWFWPAQALQRNDASVRHTATGGALHLASSLLWAGIYGWLRGQRRQPTAANAVADAAAITALAAVVDLKLVPERLTPGFERRLSQRSVLLVYAGFAAGLAAGGVLALRRD